MSLPTATKEPNGTDAVVKERNEASKAPETSPPPTTNGVPSHQRVQDLAHLGGSVGGKVGAVVGSVVGAVVGALGGAICGAIGGAVSGAISGAMSGGQFHRASTDMK
ncbi:MAG: hypothetical protein ACK4RK_07230 [Gemmataceae bacterium]